MTSQKKGILIIVSGPAGVGKGTIVKEAADRSKNSIYLSVSATTRQPRSIDKEGVTYFFKTTEEFEKMIENDELLEWAKYVDNYYGTPLKPVKEALEKGLDVILEIEVQGAFKVKEKIPEAVLAFITPPSLEILEERLRGRNTETEEQIEKRLNTAKTELEKIKDYDYVIENDTVENAVCDLFSVLRSEKLKKDKFINEGFLQKLLKNK